MLYEKAPPGREDQVKALKRKYGKRAAYAIAWASYNKSKGKDVKESYTQYFGDSAKVTGSSHKVGDRVKTHDGLVGKVTKVSKSHVEVRGHPYQHADVKKIKTGQEKADEVASAMDKLRQHLRSKGFKSVRKEEVNEVFGRLRKAMGPMNAFHSDEPMPKHGGRGGYDHGPEHHWQGKTSTGVTITADKGRDTEDFARHYHRGYSSSKKSNREKFAAKFDHAETGHDHDIFKHKKTGVHFVVHHDDEAGGTSHISRMKSRMQESSHKSDEYDDDVIKRNAKALLKDYDAQREISSGKPVKKKKTVKEGYTVKKTRIEKAPKDDEYGSDADVHHYDVIHNKSGKKVGTVQKGLFGATLKTFKSSYDLGGGGDVQAKINKSSRAKKMLGEDGDAPTNSMGSSASDPDTGNVQGVSPLLGTCKPSKRKELEKQMKAMLKK